MGVRNLHFAETALFIASDCARIVDVRIDTDGPGVFALEEMAENQRDSACAEAAIPEPRFADELIEGEGVLDVRARGQTVFVFRVFGDTVVLNEPNRPLLEFQNAGGHAVGGEDCGRIDLSHAIQVEGIVASLKELQNARVAEPSGHWRAIGVEHEAEREVAVGSQHH